MKKILLFLFSLTLAFSMTLREGNAVWMYPTDPLNPPAGDMTVEGKLTIDDSDTECLLIRADGDSADVLTVDCTNKKVILDASGNFGTASHPTLAFGSGDTGIYEVSDGLLTITINGAAYFRWNGNVYESAISTGGASLYANDSTAILPWGRTRNDGDTGVGAPGADQGDLIGGGVEALRWTEASRTIETNTTVCETDSGDLRIVTTASHALIVDDVVQFAAGTGSLCTGISANTNYYVTQVDDANKFNIATSRGGSNISWTDNGTAFTSYNLEVTVNVYGDLIVADELIATGSDPTLTSCGTSPSIAGSDMAGKISIGTGTITSCTATFATAYSNAPACVISGDSTAITYAVTTSTTVLTIISSADMATDVISYICIGI